MTRLATNDLKNAMSSMVEIITDIKFKQHVETRFDDFMNNFSHVRTGFCIDKFIDAELDFQTPGNRGLGRISDDIPRLGAYFRKQLSSLDQQEFDTIYELIQDILLRSYLVGVITVKSINANVAEEESLYKAWIPKIYVAPLEDWDSDLFKLLFAFTAPTVEKLQAFMDQHKMIGGGSSSGDKTEDILLYYCVAGYGLLNEEIGGN